MDELNIFKISYQWYEDDHKEILLGKNISANYFEKDLIEAKKFAESLIGRAIKEGIYLGKGYRVDCLPEYYEQIIWFLTKKKGDIICNIDNDTEYFIDDDITKKIGIKKRMQKIDWQNLHPSDENKNSGRIKT